jgi:2-oxoisovalerate dehydrogenase E1 component beta subunit
LLPTHPSVVARPVPCPDDTPRPLQGFSPARRRYARPIAEITYLDAVRAALADAMREDARVFLLGEDIGAFGGAFGATAGLLDEFGPERVLDTPISEEGFVGAAVGAAWMGERPVVELQFADFVSCPFDMIVTVAAKTHWRSGIPLPLVIRMPSGGGVRGGPFHASSPEGWFIGQPGLKVVCPGTVEDAYGLLRAAIDDPDPVLVFEHKGLYRRLRGPAPASERRTPLGRAHVAREGEDATVVTYGSGVALALEVAERLDANIEVIDLRTVWPLDQGAVLASLEKTARVLVLQEAARSTGVAGQVLSLVARRGFELLDAPPALHAPLDTPVPFAPELEDAYLPSSESVTRELESLLAY